MSIKVGILDDHPVVRDGVSLLLGSVEEIEVLWSSVNGESLAGFLQNEPLDVLLLDILMPGATGVELTQRFAAAFPQMRILIYSGNSPIEMVMDCLALGASGVLSKNATRQELITAIKTVHQGEEYFSANVSQSLLKKYTASSKTKTTKQEDLLTKREKEVTVLFAEGKIYKEIANELNISVNTVESHKNNILKKLQLNTTLDLVKYAIKHGLIEL
ncbi:MAG: response regulator transcription factor [Bacteroidota bacterium]